MEQLISFEAPQPIKLTVNDFAVLHDAGAFDAYPHAELLNGAVVCMSPQRSPHVMAASRLMVRLELALQRLGSKMEAVHTPTVSIPPHDAPEPDIAIVTASPADGYYPLSMVALAIEVSLTSLRHDLSDKLDLYARARVSEYWVVEVESRTVHQFWSPSDGVYLERRTIPLAGELRSLTMPELAIDGTGIL